LISGFTTAVTLEELKFDELETAEELATDEELLTIELELGSLGAFELELCTGFATVSLAAELVAAALELVGAWATGSLVADSFWAVLPCVLSAFNRSLPCSSTILLNCFLAIFTIVNLF
jgi:hypothetical protein